MGCYRNPPRFLVTSEDIGGALRCSKICLGKAKCYQFRCLFVMLTLPDKCHIMSREPYRYRLLRVRFRLTFLRSLEMRTGPQFARTVGNRLLIGSNKEVM